MKNENDFIRWQDAQVPEVTATYMPVPHQTLLDLVREKLIEEGYTINRENVEQSFDGQVISAHFILGKSAEDNAYGFTQEFGVINSYNKRKPILFASGGHVFICGNGMVVSEMTVVRKHTSRVWDEIDEKLDQAVGRMEDNWKKLINDVMSMTNVELNLTQKAELLGRLFVEEGVITITELSKIKMEISQPTFDYESDGTLWELYNHCTLVLKEAHIMRKTKALKELHDFMVDYANDYLTIHSEVLYNGEE